MRNLRMGERRRMSHNFRMNEEITTRALLCSARQIAQAELDTPDTEAILAIFYRLCIERDRRLERGDGGEDYDSRNSWH